MTEQNSPTDQDNPIPLPNWTKAGGKVEKTYPYDLAEFTCYLGPSNYEFKASITLLGGSKNVNSH